MKAVAVTGSEPPTGAIETHAPALEKSQQTVVAQPSPMPSVLPQTEASGRQYNNLTGLLIEGGIGDALTSFTAMHWLKKAYPGNGFVAFLYEHTPGRASGMLNVVETHPDLVGAFVINNPADVQRYVEQPLVCTLNISPWHFITAHFRARSPRLDYHLTRDDQESAGRWLQPVERPLLVIQPTASNPAVNWPTERWRELVGRLNTRFASIVVGGPGEAAIPEASLDLRGKLTARQTIAVVRRAVAVIAARSWVSIVSMDARIPTLVLTPPTRMHELRDYAYPPAYFEGGISRLVHIESGVERLEGIFGQCLDKAPKTVLPIALGA
jgi:hypothetical protein